MCQAPSVSFISSPCLQPVEADPPIPHCTDAEAGSGRGRDTPRSHHHQGRRLGFEPRRLTKTGRRATSPSTMPWMPTRAWTRVVTGARKRVRTAALQAASLILQQPL